MVPAPFEFLLRLSSAAPPKKAPAALSQGRRGAKSACQGTTRLPPPRILRMLLDTMRGLPRGRGAGDHGLDKHNRQPAFFASLLRTQSAPAALSLLPVLVVSSQTKSAQWLPHGDRREPVCAISTRCDSVARSRLAQEYPSSRDSLWKRAASYISHTRWCQPQSDNVIVHSVRRTWKLVVRGQNRDTLVLRLGLHQCAPRGVGSG